MQEHNLKNCKFCGKLMERKRYSNGELECWNWYNRRVYCSTKCMADAHRAKPKVGTSWMTVHYHARHLKPEGNCEICGSDRNVDVHHIDGNPQNNSLDNLMRVCRSCHYRIHHPHAVCKICGKKAKGKGFCEKHYVRFKKYGDPLMTAHGKVED